MNLNYSPDKPGITISVTVGQFEEEDFEVLRRRLQPRFRIGGGAAYELSEAEVARIVIEFTIATLQVIPQTLLTSTLYDALKTLILKGRNSTPKFRTTLEFKVTGDDISQITGGRQYVYARLETDSEEIAKKGLDSLKELARREYQEEAFEFDPQEKLWERRE